MDKVDHLKCQKYIVPSQPVTCLLNRSLGRLTWTWERSSCLLVLECLWLQRGSQCTGSSLRETCPAYTLSPMPHAICTDVSLVYFGAFKSFKTTDVDEAKSKFGD